MKLIVKLGLGLPAVNSHSTQQLMRYFFRGFRLIKINILLQFIAPDPFVTVAPEHLLPISRSVSLNTPSATLAGRRLTKYRSGWILNSRYTKPVE